VGPLQSQGIGGGLVGAYLATAREKTEKARGSLERELSKISSKGLSSEELLWARSFLIGNHEIGLQRTSSQAMTMALMELYGLGWDDFQTYPDRLRAVTMGDATAAALPNPKAAVPRRGATTVTESLGSTSRSPEGRTAVPGLCCESERGEPPRAVGSRPALGTSIVTSSDKAAEFLTYKLGSTNQVKKDVVRDPEGEGTVV